VPERKLFKAVISSKARNLIILLILNFKISPYGRNDIRLLRDSGLCEGIDYSATIKESEEIIKILTSIVKTTQERT
jgi:hypothetical protein